MLIVGFIRRWSPHDDENKKYNPESTIETWYILNFNLGDWEHYHLPNCYGLKNEEGEVVVDKNNITYDKIKNNGCGKVFHSHFYKGEGGEKNGYINDDGAHLMDDTIVHKHEDGTYKQYNHHKHTLKCWPGNSGTIEHIDTVENVAYYSGPYYDSVAQQPFLIVNECSTTVLKKEFYLDSLNIDLWTNVSAYTYIKSINYITNEIPNVNDPNRDNSTKWFNDCTYRVDSTDGNIWIDMNGKEFVAERRCGPNDRLAGCKDVNDVLIPYLTGDDVFDAGYDAGYWGNRAAWLNHYNRSKDPANVDCWRTEDWKNKDNIAVLEAGDTVKYYVVLKNDDDFQRDVSIEYKLPDNLENDIKIECLDPRNMNVVKPTEDEEKNGVKTYKDIDLSQKTNNILTTSDFPRPYIKGYNEPGSGRGVDYFRMNPKTASMFVITAKVKTAEKSYSTSNPKDAKIKIIETLKTSGASIANWSDRRESKDSFICKQYNVTVNSAITGLFRTGSGNSVGTEIDSEKEYVVENEAYKFDDDERLNKNQTARSVYPLFVENGDCITYKIILNNNANNSSPYYNPKKVDVSLYIKKPTDTAEVVLISNQDTATEKSIGTLSYNSSTQMLTDPIQMTNGQEIAIWITFRMNNSKTTTYDYSTLRDITAKITKLTNINGKETTAGLDNCAYRRVDDEGMGMVINGGEILNNVPKSSAMSSDYFRVKEYNVVVDKYISKVEHVESRGGTSVTYEAEERRSPIHSKVSGKYSSGDGEKDDIKENSPVSVEYGDKVTYTIRIYNTTDDPDFYNVGRTGEPYKSPQLIKLDITDTLPEKFSNLQVTVPSGSNATIGSWNVEKNTLSLSDVEIKAGCLGKIDVTLNVEEVSKGETATNTVQFDNDDIKNINDYRVINNGNRNSASDKYKLNNYKASLEEYIDDFGAEMAKYNNANGFTSGESEGFPEETTRSDSTTSYPSNNPLDVEKYETVTFATKVINQANQAEDEEDESYSTGYNKYKTRVRPTDVRVTLDEGLTYQSYSVKWYNANGGVKATYDSNNKITDTTTPKISQGTVSTAQQIKYIINDENIILSPGEYLVYYTTVKVTESNLCLDNLKCHSKIETLTNVNRKDPRNGYGTNNNGVISDNGHNRIVTNENTSTQKTDEDYVRLKDVVIAGNVWLDDNRDGEKNNETGKVVTVKLYGDKEKEDEYKQIGSSIETNNNGFYTFGRVNRAVNGRYIKYYVEFEYDGLKYKATEVYGGDTDGNADGMNNLGGKNGSRTWIQGYSDLTTKVPNVTLTGNEKYKIDSNAYEFDDVRNEFDNKYKTIGFNQAYDSNDTLSYTKNGHISTLNENFGNENRKMTARSFIKQDYSGTVNKSFGNTNMLFLNESVESYQYKYHNTYPETEYLKFINLGLVEREKVDISIDSDVKEVKNTINGEEMTYNYGKNKADSSSEKYNENENAYKLKNAYELKLYDADYNYKYDTYYNETLKDYKGEESELTSEVTYTINVRNKAINDDEISEVTDEKIQYKDIPIEAQINEMAIYYDSNFVKIDNNTKNTGRLVRQKDIDTGLFTKIKEGKAEYNDRYIPNIKIRYKEGSEWKDFSTDYITMESQYGNVKPTTMTNTENDPKEGYNVLYLENLTNFIPEGETRTFEITFVVDKYSDRNLKISEKNMGLEMIAEVSAYSTRYKPNSSDNEKDGYYHQGLAGKNAGLVDCDSNPGNLHLNGIENYDNYEDDKYKVGIKVSKFSDSPETPSGDNPEPGKRSLVGIVWEDDKNTKIGTKAIGEQSIGDGKYDNSEESKDKPITGVKATLIEMVQTESGKYYEYPARYTYDVKDSSGNVIHSKGQIIEDVSGNDGKYTLKDYIPGYYKVRFDYGYNSNRNDNIKYNGQDYKSTQYYNEYGDEHKLLYYDESNGKYSNDNIGCEDNFKYFDNVKATLGIENKSDAQDDEIRRLNVNSYSETMTALQAVVFSETSETSKLGNSDEEKAYKESNDKRLTQNTAMYAESAIFYTKPENVDSSEKEIDATTENFNATRLWSIDNLDFGLEYRPEASILLDKQIAHMELVTSDGKKLVELYFKEKEEDGETKRIIDKNKSTGYDNVQYMANTGKESQGFVYINVDTKILEGSTVKIEYEMTANNDSEVDRINKNLDDIKYEKGASDKQYTGVYTTRNANVEESTQDIEFTYNANATAAELLASKYYDGYKFEEGKEKYNYLICLKKPYKNVTEKTKISDVELVGQEYYGMYLGQTYYTGNIGDNDIVAELKVDHILDYVDNDLEFSQTENSTKNKLWKRTTSKELYENNVLNWNKVNRIKREEKNKDGTENKEYNELGKYGLIDHFGILYDTKERSNLALSVDDNKSGNENENRKEGNVSLSKFLKPQSVENDNDKKKKSKGIINLIASKILSADDIVAKTGLSYDNISEVVQYTSLTGRRTKLPDADNGGGVIGNANTKYWIGYDGTYEDDTDATELITISPPTGLIK